MGSENPVERAFALARSGACRDLRDLERKLRHEGLANASQHLSGRLLRRQVSEAIREAAANSNN